MEDQFNMVEGGGERSIEGKVTELSWDANSLALADPDSIREKTTSVSFVDISLSLSWKLAAVPSDTSTMGPLTPSLSPTYNKKIILFVRRTNNKHIFWTFLGLVELSLN